MASRRIEVEIIGDPRSVEAAFGRSLSASQKFQRGLAPVARGAKLAIAGIAGLSIVSVKLANDFNRTSSQMVGLAGVGAKQVEEWKSAILDLAPVVGQVPNELAKSLYFIASSGVPASKALNALKISAMGATAGLGETEVVADAVTSAMNAYAQENLSAAEAADVLAATVREGKGEAAAIAPVLGNILPIASQLGVGFDEVGAAMASMTRLGFDAATAATNLSGVLSAILKPQKQAEEGFKKVGTSSAELQRMLSQRGLLQTLQFLEDRFKGNNAAMAHAFPNVRALRGVLSLVGKAGDDTAAVFKRMEDNTGALGHAFRAAADTDAFRLDQAFAELQADGVRLGSDVAPAVASLATELANAAGFAAEHGQATKIAAASIVGFSIAVIGANSALKVYNSELVKVLGMQGALRGALAVGGWVALGAAIVLVVHEGLNQLEDALNKTPAAFQEAEDAANDYRQALTDLNSSATGYQDAQSRLAHAQLNVEQTAKDARRAVRDAGKGSLEARQAALAHRDAVRELDRAERNLTKTHRENIDAQQRTAIGVRRTSNSIDALRSEFLGLTKGIDRSKGANDALLRGLDAGALAGFEQRVRRLAEANGGLDTQAGRAALAVADLTVKLGRIPTRKEIRLVTNADHTRDQIEAVRAAVERVPRTHYIDFYVRTHGSINAPTGVAKGTGTGASGGIVTRPTFAVIGERGPEAVIPLNRMRGARPLGGALDGGGSTYVFQFPNYVGDRGELERAMRGAIEKMLRKGAAFGARRP